MNRLTIIGNLTKDPETRMTQTGMSVCTFSVAVNRRHQKDEVADFFRVSAWGKLGELCQNSLNKGSKVAVVGSVSVSTFQTKNGETRVNLDVMANEVEFLSKKTADSNDGYVKVDEEELPFK